LGAGCDGDVCIQPRPGRRYARHGSDPARITHISEPYQQRAEIFALPPDDQAIARPAAERGAEIERDLQGRLGVAILDTANGRSIDYHATDRFPMCGTFKFLLSGAVLQRVEKQQEQLDSKIAYGSADLSEWAPVTKQHVQEGSMTVDALCAAAVEYSDNTAANLLLQTIGGPRGLTEFVRSLGDPVTRLDRNKPTLNAAIKGDERDTTTPVAILNVGETLSAAGRQRLEGWLVPWVTNGYAPDCRPPGKSGTKPAPVKTEREVTRPLRGRRTGN
jgi:beta-lactamase class A